MLVRYRGLPHLDSRFLSQDFLTVPFETGALWDRCTSEFVSLHRVGEFKHQHSKIYLEVKSSAVDARFVILKD